MQLAARNKGDVKMLTEKIDRIIKNAVPGEIIFPGRIARENNVALIDVYKKLGSHENRNAVKSVLALYCPTCGKNTGILISSFLELPETVSCPHCGRTCNDFARIVDNAIVVYQKL